MILNESQNESSNSTIEYIINYNEYAFAFLSLIGSITSIINILVFLNNKLNDPVFKYYLTKSFLDFFYAFSLTFYPLIGCGTICNQLYGTLLTTHLYNIIIVNYLTSSCAIIVIFIELFVSVQRLFIILNKSWLMNANPKYVLTILIILGILYYSPIIFVQRIIEIDINEYQVEYTEFGNSYVGRLIPLILSSIRLVLASIVLLLVNLITLFHFRKHIKKKSSIQKSYSSKYS